MNLKELKEWDKQHPDKFAKIVFVDGRILVGVLKDSYPGDPKYQGGGVQTNDYFYFLVNQKTEVFNVSDILTIEEA